jgi:putative membrane protein
MRFLARLLLNGVAIIAAAWFVPGLELSGPSTALLAGAILGFVNALVRPVLFVLTLPLTLLTLGLFIFVLNAICLGLTAALVPGFTIDGFPLLPITTIGRASSNTIVLDNGYVSTEHVLITRRGDQWWLEDMGSRNGTLLNGVELGESAVISVGDVIGIGQTQFKVEL